MVYTFFHFPKDETRRKRWIHYCKRADFTVATQASRLSSKHFSGDQYVRDPLKLAQYGYENARPKLENDAVPDIPINVDTSSTLSQSGMTATGQILKRGAYEKRMQSEVSQRNFLLCKSDHFLITASRFFIQINK
ncbi:MAG: THAP domain-containing protein [Candidatus Thiodiazotropha sp.]